MKLIEIVPENAVSADLRSSERDAVVAELVDVLIASGSAPAEARDELIERVLERERKGSTGFGRGVAVPHVKHGSVDKMAAAIGLSRSGVDFNALDKQPVYSVFLLLSPEDRPEEHLQAMEAIFRSLSKEPFRRALRQAGSGEDVRELLSESEDPAVSG